MKLNACSTALLFAALIPHAGCLSAPASNPALGSEPNFALASADAPLASTAAPRTTVQAAPAPEQADEWRFGASAYLWLAGTSGVVSQGTLGIPLDDADEASGAFLYFEAEKGRWGVSADLNVIETTDVTQIAGATATVDEDNLIGELCATWRPEENSTLQLLAGLRLLDAEQRLTINPPGAQVSGTTTQVDPILGAQGIWPLAESLEFRLRGDIGGFGIDSDFTYQMFGVLAWEFVPHWGLTLGYRVLGWEFEGNGLETDLRLAGVLFGLAATF